MDVYACNVRLLRAGTFVDRTLYLITDLFTSVPPYHLSIGSAKMPVLCNHSLTEKNFNTE
jgi:hypothetical protein